MVLTDAAHATDARLRHGLYEVTFHLELPHLERWSVYKTSIVCVPLPTTLLPVLSDNTPFAACLARNLQSREGIVSFDIACSGRAAAKAQGTYVLTQDGFTARIAMTMGAKNMTMTEVQSARRLGSCPLLDVQSMSLAEVGAVHE